MKFSLSDCKISNKNPIVQEKSKKKCTFPAFFLYISQKSSTFVHAKLLQTQISSTLRMTKAKLIKGTQWHGKWGKNHYIAQRPGQPAEEVSIKANPKQPFSEAQLAQMKSQDSRLIDANATVHKVLNDPEANAAAWTRFQAFCAEHGDTYRTKKTGKVRKRRFIDFLRSKYMKNLPIIHS